MLYRMLYKHNTTKQIFDESQLCWRDDLFGWLDFEGVFYPAESISIIDEKVKSQEKQQGVKFDKMIKDTGMQETFQQMESIQKKNAELFVKNTYAITETTKALEKAIDKLVEKEEEQRMIDIDDVASDTSHISRDRSYYNLKTVNIEPRIL